MKKLLIIFCFFLVGCGGELNTEPYTKEEYTEVCERFCEDDDDFDKCVDLCIRNWEREYVNEPRITE